MPTTTETKSTCGVTSKRSSNRTTIDAVYIRRWAIGRRKSSSGMRIQR
jgi:hypothetical protein